jgi:CHAT domain-containing protein/tetratricopeptide (TPR) repeat protein
MTRIIRSKLGYLWVSSLILVIWLGQIHSPAYSREPGSEPASATAQLVQQGVDRYRAGNYTEAIALWQTALSQYQQSHDANVVLVQENLARAYGEVGQTENALAAWDAAIRFYQQAGDRLAWGRTLTEQAQVYSRLGQPRQAIARLCGDGPVAAPQETGCASDSAVYLARTAADLPGTIAALGSLGDAYQLAGDNNDAIAILQAGLAIDQRLSDSPYRVSLLNSLGNAYSNRAQINYRRTDLASQRAAQREANEFRQRGQNDDQQALAAFQEGEAIAATQSNLQGQLQSLLGAIPIYTRNGSERATTALEQAQTLLRSLPASQRRVYMAIDLARMLTANPADADISGYRCPTAISSTSEALLTDAVAIAQQLQNQRAKSFALGELGHLYECRGQSATALDLTQQARWAAEQDLSAKDSLYLWEWQTGRILKAQGNIPAAIAAYDRAIATLEAIRGDILTAVRETQFNFRDTVEPIYRGVIALRLSQESSSTASKSLTVPSDSDNVSKILQTIDSLKLAELQNYFGNGCVVVAPQQGGLNAALDQTTAILNTVILDDKAAVILSLPSGEEHLSWIDLPRSQLVTQINAFRIELEYFRRRDYNSRPAQQLYDWLIRPFTPVLEQAQVKTLVFVQDGIFRSIPMAALQDGDRFLVERYAIATTPSLTLTEAKVITRSDLKVLALGLTQAVEIDGQDFVALPNIQQELAGITAIIPNSRELLNQDFTRDRLRQELSRTAYPIIHIATHGKFGTDPEDTFILTGDGKKLTFNELERLIRTVARNPDPLELLALTACETAAGDDRAALGLAGVAVQAGAKSALASLWLIDDATTAKIATQFYNNLRQLEMSRAEALRMAQLALLQNSTQGSPQFIHPGLWSALVLVGNWR